MIGSYTNAATEAKKKVCTWSMLLNPCEVSERRRCILFTKIKLSLIQQLNITNGKSREPHFAVRSPSSSARARQSLEFEKKGVKRGKKPLLYAAATKRKTL